MRTLPIGYCLLLACLMICCSSCETPDNPEMTEQIIQSRKLRSLIQSDPHRPIYHFVAPEGRAYPFDPNGAIFWNGQYHLGFIYQYLANGKREHFWGHAVSNDLLHWTLLPDMLSAREGDIERGIFSGGAFLSREGIPHIMYHGEGSSTNLVAYSTDPDLKEWKKFEGNPVLRTPGEGHPDHGKYDAWDPEGWYDAETDYYYQISGGNPAGFFRSEDMRSWEYLGDLIDQNNRMRHDFEDLSCPDFFALGDKHMLLFISHNLGTQYYLGEWSDGTFTPERHDRMNWPGGTFFAPEQLVDDKGRNIIWGWVLERRPDLLDWVNRENKNIKRPENQPARGWSGIMSLPRVVSLSETGDVLVNPPDELRSLRWDEHAEGPLTLSAGMDYLLSGRGKSLEIEVLFDGGNATEYGIKVFSSADGREETIVKYDAVSNELVIDFSHSAASGEGSVNMLPNAMLEPQLEGFLKNVSEQRAPLLLGEGENLQLDVFIDRSVIEVFANGRLCVTQVVYPELPESDRIVLFASDNEVDLTRATTWRMASTNMY